MCAAAAIKPDSVHIPAFTHTAVIAGLTGRPSFPETPAMESRSRGVLGPRSSRGRQGVETAAARVGDQASATITAVIARLDRATSIPETPAMESRSRGVPGPRSSRGRQGWKTAAPRVGDRGLPPPSQLSSPGLTGRPRIPETPVMESRSRGVLGPRSSRGRQSGDGRRWWTPLAARSPTRPLTPSSSRP